MSTLHAPLRRGIAIAAFLAVAASLCPEGAEASDAFYDPSGHEIAGAAGTLMRQEPLPTSPFGASAYRILYRSTGLDGHPIAASGAVIVPNAPPPPNGRRVVVWAHPTSGIVPACAPSMAGNLFEQIQGLREMLDRGYAVVAPDYPGLGTEGPHPYLVGISEGRSVLDAARAARAIPASGIGRQVGLWGHSQGGQAVLFAGTIAHAYAPELEIAGIAAAAPATDLATLLRDDFATAGGKNLMAMTLWSWSRVYDAPIDKIVAPEAMPEINKLANDCLESLLEILPRRQVTKDLEKTFLLVDDVVDLEPWRSLVRQNTVGTLPPSIPVFVAQGLDDKTVRPEVTADYVKRLCRAGSKVDYMTLPNAGHIPVARDAAGAAIQWLSQRFAGEPASSTC